MSTDMLRQEQILQTVSGTSCVVKELLGRGGQGEVYRVTLAGDLSMALKWYYPHTATQDQWQALETLISKGSPSEKFLWPLDLVRADRGSQFGYLMPLRPERFKSVVDLMRRSIEPLPTLQALTVTGRELADSYFQLHVRGLCYRDISFGNVFFDPCSGEVMICDNDNVTVNGSISGGVLGTSRFMAPEIVRGEALPSTETDRFSLAVLLFYILMFHHPLEGKREADIHVFDPAAMTKIYGTDPLFIFDPDDNTNAPVKGYQDNVLICWPIYPQFLRDLFTRAFTDGLSDAQNGRVLENEWRTAMVRLHDSVFYCAQCRSQNFYDIATLKKNEGVPPLCWSCAQQVILPYRIRIESHIIMLNEDTKLYPHHINRQKKWDFSQPVAQVNRHPTDRNRWGLKNVSSERWVITKPDGTKQDVAVGQNAPLAVNVKINFGNAEGEIRY
jgi:DNA-binding helix-hairpin-helix protein with protein kinase domain